MAAKNNGSYLFENREALLVNYDKIEIMEAQIIKLFEYSLKEEGIADSVVMKLILKHLAQMIDFDLDFSGFLHKISETKDSSGGSFVVQLDAEKHKEFFAEDGHYFASLDENQKRMILDIFDEYLALYRRFLFKLEQFEDMNFGSHLTMQFVWRHIQNGWAFPFEAFFKVFFERYKLTSESIDTLRTKLTPFLFRFGP